ncbi:MAG: T9SS type A sorting domain-containing protein [Crocinitomicaceae bacterium]|nr:T9SS type A sorting domain-containing protein [Crocinitomicaceae bacterium]
MITGHTAEINGIEASLKMEMFPNPSTDFITINVDKNQLPYSFKVIDAEGKVVVKTREVFESSLKVDLS